MGFTRGILRFTSVILRFKSAIIWSGQKFLKECQKWSIFQKFQMRDIFGDFQTLIFWPNFCVIEYLPKLRGSHPFTVLARSTSTKTRRPSIFLPSACLYAAVSQNHKSKLPTLLMDWLQLYTHLTLTFNPIQKVPQ